MEPSEGRWRIQVGLRRHYAEHSARIASFNPHDAPTLARSQPASQRQDWGSNPGLSARARAAFFCPDAFWPVPGVPRAVFLGPPRLHAPQGQSGPSADPKVGCQVRGPLTRTSLRPGSLFPLVYPEKADMSCRPQPLLSSEGVLETLPPRTPPGQTASLPHSPPGTACSSVSVELRHDRADPDPSLTSTVGVAQCGHSLVLGESLRGVFVRPCHTLVPEHEQGVGSAGGCPGVPRAGLQMWNPAPPGCCFQECGPFLGGNLRSQHRHCTLSVTSVIDSDCR